MCGSTFSNPHTCDTFISLLGANLHIFLALILFPNCKINLGLYVTGKRPDGYHNIETCFYPIPLQDVLEIIEQPDATETTLSLSGITIEQSSNNSCRKAYALLKKDFPQLTPVQIHLHKAIPVGGGLGGGSA